MRVLVRSQTLWRRLETTDFFRIQLFLAVARDMFRQTEHTESLSHRFNDDILQLPLGVLAELS